MDDTNIEDESAAEKLNDEMRRAVMPVTVFVGVEAVLAFFGNLIVLYVFLFRYDNGNFRYFVLCLTLIDLTCALTTMPGEVLTQLNWYVYPVPMICKIKSFFNLFTVSSETFCFLTIAVDRYRKVCHPLGWQIKLKVARGLCLGIYMAGFVISLPVAFFWGTHKDIENGNITTTVCEKDEKYVDTHKPFDFSVSVESVISVCLACMIVLYGLIAWTVMFQNRLNKASHELPTAEGTELENNHTNVISHISKNEDHSSEYRESASSDKQMEPSRDSPHHKSDHAHTIDRRAFTARVRRKTLIMFILTITFTATTILYMTMLSLIAKGILTDLSDSDRAAYFFFFRLYFINHVINPIVYGVLDPQFRNVMRTCRRERADSHTRSSQNVN